MNSEELEKLFVTDLELKYKLLMFTVECFPDKEIKGENYKTRLY